MSRLPPLSVLDLCPVTSGSTAADAIRRSVALAQSTERMGYRRYWFAEHHNMLGIASSSPEILIGHIAQATRTIRVGSGGVMLPNHAPLRVAETFRTLEALFPGRIDLGLGRAPGSGSQATRALRGSIDRMRADDFPSLYEELTGYLSVPEVGNERSVDSDEISYASLTAMPTVSSAPEIWILGSSDYGARFAAQKGLPFAFAQHFSPMPAAEVMELYRSEFRPSADLASPRAILAVHVICADTEEQALELSTGTEVSFYRFRQTGQSNPLMSPAEVRALGLSSSDWAQIRSHAFPKFVGAAEEVRERLSAICERTQADELMITTMVHDAEARLHSYELLAATVEDSK